MSLTCRTIRRNHIGRCSVASCVILRYPSAVADAVAGAAADWYPWVDASDNADDGAADCCWASTDDDADDYDDDG